MTISKTIQERLEEYFKLEEKTDSIIFHSLSLYIYQSQIKNKDLYMLANLISEEDLIKLINYYDGDIIKMPSKDEYIECYLLAITFFFKEIKGYTWSEIKDFLSLPKKDEEFLSSIALGRKISSIKLEINNDILERLKTCTPNKVKKLFKEVDDGVKRKKRRRAN